MKNKLQIPVLVLLLAVTVFQGICLADGKLYSREKVPPVTPYQRAVISFQGNKELLLLQVKFSGDGREFGWVLPLPQPPELMLSLNAKNADFIFAYLNSRSQGNVIGIFSGILPKLLFSGLFLYMFIIPAIFGLLKKERPAFFKPCLAVRLLCYILFTGTLVYFAVPTYDSLSAPERVDIISAQRVGVFDTIVLKASDSGELIKWLKNNGYNYSAEDKRVFDRYIKTGWCFVTAKINPAEIETENYVSVEGMVNPLVFIFPTTKPVYPVALTGLGTKKLELLLYVFAEHRVEGRAPLKVAYAGKNDHLSILTAALLKEILKDKPIDEYIDEYIEEDSRLKALEAPFLTKFRGKLYSRDMKEDLVFTETADRNEYRETRYLFK